MRAINFIAKNNQYKVEELNKNTRVSREKQAGKIASSFNCKNIIVNIFSSLLCGSLSLFLFSTVFAQQSTKNTADQMLRSNGRVNPSSLGMEFDLPLGEYPGRGVNLPLGLSYSSKLWRFQEDRIDYLNNGSQNVYVFARYSENAAAGWTTSLSHPYIEYTGELNRFDNYGRPLPGEILGPNQQSPPGDNYIKRITVFLPSGASHELRAQDAPVAIVTPGNPPSMEGAWEGTFYATDGSGLKYVQDSANNIYKLWTPDGSFYTFNTGSMENKSSTDPTPVRRAYRLTDAHGNYIQFSQPDPNNSVEMQAYPYGYWTDSSGRKFPVMIPRETPTMPANLSVIEKSFNMPGMSQPYILRWKRLKGDTAATSAITDFDNQQLHYAGHTDLQHIGNTSAPATYSPSLFSGGAGYQSQISSCSQNHLWVAIASPHEKFNPVVLSEVVLPNGAKYRFTYNEFGEIERIHYPTGGFEKMSYKKVASLAEMPAPYQQVNRGVEEQSIYESSSDSTPRTWTYSAASSKNNFRTSVIAPDGNQTDRFMHRGVPEPPCSIQNSAGYHGVRWWGYDNVLAGIAYEERLFSSGGQILQRKLTRWTATATTVEMASSRPAQRNARVISTETILYDGDAGLSSATKMSYDADADVLGSPQNIVKTTQYSFKVVSGGSGFSPATPMQTPPEAVAVVPDPTQSAVESKSVENTYLLSDPNISQSDRDIYRANNFVKLITLSVTKGANDVIASQNRIEYDAPNYSPAVGRGLPTSFKSWLHSPGETDAWLQRYVKYDTYGNEIEATDNRGKITKTEYDQTYHTYPVKITTAIPDSTGVTGSNTVFETAMTYNTVTGLQTSVTDINGHTTQMQYADPLLRPTKVIKSNGQETVTEYGVVDSSGQFPANQRFIKVKTQIDESNWKVSYTWSDGFGRPVKTQNVDLQGDIFVKTQYDNLGRVKKSTNPFRGENTPDNQLEWTENFYDALGRITKVKTPDNAETNMSYSLATTGNQLGTEASMTDHAGKQKRSITNALGQVIRLDEPNDAGQLGVVDNPNQPTFYSYDVLSNMTTITQGAQTRNFVFDSLLRLRESSSPEAGTVYYTYDENSNLKTKRDNRGIKTIYDYDNLNRLVKKCFRLTQNGNPGATGCAAAQAETPEPNTSDIEYTYDNVSNGKGRLIKVANGFSSTEYVEFDSLGKITKSRQTTDNVVYEEMTYTYNLAGALIEQKYPSGRVIRNIFDNNGDLSRVQSKKNQNQGFWTYVSHFDYDARGAAISMQLGNGMWESTQFNSRLQPIQTALGTTENSNNLLKLDYAYGVWENGALNQQKNNGNLARQIITVPAIGQVQGFIATQTYTYDSLNRLKQAAETVANQTSWQQTFVYDRYGNRQFDESNTTTLTKQCGTTPNFTVCPGDRKRENPELEPANNRIKEHQDGDSIKEYEYDSAGNLIKDVNGKTFTYDAENKQVEVRDSSISNPAANLIGRYFYDGDGKRVKKYVPATGEVTIFVYDASGQLAAEYSTQISQTPQVSYLTADRLGTPRIRTAADGSVIARHDYYPFGKELTRTGYGSNDKVRKKFTGYERDGETNLDFAQARYHDYNLGRFNSPDPILMKEKRMSDPQAINLYVYVRNNPLNYVDPDGKEFRDEEGNLITVTIVDGWVVVDCAKCKDTSQQLKDLKKLRDMINRTWSTTAAAQLAKLDASKTTIHLKIDTTTVTTDAKKIRGGVFQPHGTTAEGTQNVPLDWDRDAGFFKGTPDINGKGDNAYYREATMILYEAQLAQTLSDDFLDEAMLANFAHEAQHNFQAPIAAAGKRADPTDWRGDPYHPPYQTDPRSPNVQQAMVNREISVSRPARMAQRELLFNGGCFVPDF